MHDIDIRIKIKTTYLKKYYSDSDSKVVDEFSVSIGDARMDIAVINGFLHGYEIKSESDTLYRLANQITIYSKTFDYLTIVTGQKHLESVINEVPSWWGVIVASKNKTNNGIRLKALRKPKKNVYVDSLSLAQLLWRNEAIDVLKSIGIIKGLSGKAKPFLWELISKSFSTKELSQIVRHKLKIRVNWKSDKQFFQNDDCSQFSST